MSMDKLFLRDEKRIKKLYDTELLAHLLLLNYQFSNNKYHNISASEIFKNLHRVKYSKKDLKTIGIVEFMDSVQRLQVYESTHALINGMYSGFVDSSKLKKEDFNFMRSLMTNA